MSTVRFQIWPGIFIARRERLNEARKIVTSETLHEAERYFHARIPLTRTMGVRVASFDERGLTIEAPVALNHNHLHTAFGGSVNAVATLAGYGYLWLQLRDESAHVVVAESSIRFLHGIRETICAICAPPAACALDAFMTTLRQRGKARLSLAVVVEENGAIAAEFSGTFVAFSDSGKAPTAAAAEGHYSPAP